MAMATSEQTKKPKSAFRRFAPLTLIILATIFAYFRYGDYLSFEALSQNRDSLIVWRDSNYVLAVVVFMLVYIAAVSFSLPGALFLSLGGGFLFGVVAATIMVVISATIGATAIFLAAKTGLGDSLHAKLHQDGDGFMARMEKGLHENEISYLFIMRLVPAVPFFLANLAPAFLGVSLRNYVFTTFFGIMPGTAVFVWVGSGLGEVFAQGGTPNLGIIFEWEILGPLLALSALSALPIVVKKLRKKA